MHEAMNKMSPQAAGTDIVQVAWPKRPGLNLGTSVFHDELQTIREGQNLQAQFDIAAIFVGVAHNVSHRFVNREGQTVDIRSPKPRLRGAIPYHTTKDVEELRVTRDDNAHELRTIAHTVTC